MRTSQQSEITIGSASARPGETALGSIPVAELNDRSLVQVPVGIINGAGPGPGLFLITGTHGGEYVGMGAIQRLFHRVQAAEVRGAVVAIPMANVLAYRALSRMAPQDGLDMNRIWPGAPIERAMHVFAHTEIVADRLFQEIKAWSDCLVDIHCGSITTLISPYAAYYPGGPEGLEEKVRALAYATGMPLIWETHRPFVQEKVPGSIKLQMEKLGIPSITVEYGGEGRLPTEHARVVERALLNVMKHLGMVEGAPEREGEQVLVRKGHWLRAPRGGVLWRQVDIMERVRRGQEVATITDFFGNDPAVLRSPVDGIVIGVRTIGVVNSGEYTVNVGSEELL